MDGHSSTNVHLRTSWHRVINFQATASNCRGMSKIGQVLDTMGNPNFAVGFQVKWNTIEYTLFIYDLYTLNCLKNIFYSNISHFGYKTRAIGTVFLHEITNLNHLIIQKKPKKKTKYSHDCKLIFKIMSHVYEIRSDS